MSRERARFINRISSVADHFLFLVIFTVGATGIFFARLFTDIPAIYVLILPITLMLIYGLIIWKTERYRLREDRAADNLYYLGFLFTVTTLMVALVRYRYATEPDVNQIIGDLGLGLLTTILGLVGRIFFGQLRQDPEEIEEQTRLMLADAAEKTRTQLFAANERMGDVQAQAHQMLLDGKKSIDLAHKGIIDSIAGLEKKIEGINIPSDLISKKTDPVVEKFEQSIDSLTKKLDAIEVSPQVIAERANEAFKPLDSSIERLRQTIADFGKTFDDVKKHKDDIAGFVKSAESIAASREQIASWATEIATSEKRLVALNASVRESQEALVAATASQKNLAAATQQQIGAYRKAMEGIVATIAKTQTSVNGLSRTTETLAQNFAKAMADLVELANRVARG